MSGRRGGVGAIRMSRKASAKEGKVEEIAARSREATSALRVRIGKKMIGKRTLLLQRIGITLVAHAADGQDEGWVGDIRFEPLAQAANMHIDRAWFNINVLTPD